MAKFHQSAYWSTRYWIPDYWPESGGAGELDRTEPVTYLPNSHYVSGYWVDTYWPKAFLGTLVDGKLCIGAITMTIPGMTVAAAVPSAGVVITKPGATITIEDCD